MTYCGTYQQVRRTRRNSNFMEQGRIVIITGAPGTSKITIALRLARESDASKSVHMHTDDGQDHGCVCPGNHAFSKAA